MMQLRKTRRRKGRLCHIKLTTVTDIHCFQRLVPQSPSIHRSLIPNKFCKIVELLYFLRWSVCRYSSNGRHNIQTFITKTKTQLIKQPSSNFDNNKNQILQKE